MRAAVCAWKGIKRVIVVAGLPVHHYRAEDAAAKAYAMVFLVDSGFAPQTDVARAFGCSVQTVARNRQGIARSGENTWPCRHTCCRTPSCRSTRSTTASSAARPTVCAMARALPTRLPRARRTAASDARLCQGDMAERAAIVFPRSGDGKAQIRPTPCHREDRPEQHIRITTYLAGESEVKIVDPSRIREVQPFGCEAHFVPPMEC